MLFTLKKYPCLKDNEPFKVSGYLCKIFLDTGHLQINTFHICLIILFCQKRWALFISNSVQQNEKMKLTHEDVGLMKGSQPLIAHCWRTNCVDLFKKRHYWPGITAEMAKYLAACHRCQTRKSVKLQKVK